MSGRLRGLWVVGGRQRARRALRSGQAVWQGYDRGLILHVDLASSEVRSSFEYESPPDAAADESAISLQASTLEGDRLYTCTETEVMVYRLPEFEQLAYVSLPCFNDVHHVRPSGSGSIVVANAGLDMVLEVSTSGEVLRTWSAAGEDPWARFDPNVDYRKLSTKPHAAHPNFVFYVGDELWATRFQQGDAVCLTTPGRSIQLSSKRIHDGVLSGGRLYFTVVDGSIVVVDAATLEVEDVIDLNAFHEERTVLGWCRGLLVDGDLLYVGFSRIRPTKVRENVGWVARGFRRSKPTHVGCYDLVRRACVSEIDLEPARLSALYSILPAKDPPPGDPVESR